MKVAFNHNLLSRDSSDAGYLPIALRKKVFLETILGPQIGLFVSEPGFYAQLRTRELGLTIDGCSSFNFPRVSVEVTIEPSEVDVIRSSLTAQKSASNHRTFDGSVFHPSKHRWLNSVLSESRVSANNRSIDQRMN